MLQRSSAIVLIPCWTEHFQAAQHDHAVEKFRNEKSTHPTREKVVEDNVDDVLGRIA
jgi:hypothetical protein